MIFSIAFFLRNWVTKEMTGLEDNNNLCNFVFDHNSQERKSWSCLGQTCSSSSIVFLSQPFDILFIVFGCFWRIHFQKLETNQLFGLKICAVWQDTFYLHQDYEHVNFYKKLSLLIIGWSFRTWKNAVCLQVAKNWNTLTPVWQKLFFQSTFSTFLRCNAIGNWKPRVCAWSKLWIFWFVEKQRYKVLVNIRRLLWRDMHVKNLCWPCNR